MSLSIVIALFCSSIMLFSLFFIAKVHCSESRVNVGDDFITVFLKDRERVIKKSGSRMAISTYLLILGISPLAVGTFVYFFSQNGLFSILMAFMGFLIPDILLMIIRNSTQKKYEERYARALNQMGSSLRAGLSIARAVEDVAQCKFVHPSMQKCFAKLSADLQMGLPVSEAFQRMADDCGNEDAQDVALAIAVQDTVGGHEADISLPYASYLVVFLLNCNSDNISPFLFQIYLLQYLAFHIRKLHYTFLSQNHGIANRPGVRWHNESLYVPNYRRSLI